MLIRPITHADRLPVADLLERLGAELDGEPVGERKVLALEVSPAGLVAEADGTVVGVAPWVGADPRTFEVAAMAPEVADALVAAVVGEGNGRRLRAWSLRGRDDVRYAAAGFILERDLHEMARSLPLPSDPVEHGLTFRGFRAGDEQAWLDVNNRAFEGHAEQGGLTLEDFAARRSRPWFSADGLRMAEHDGRPVGFCWTKVRRDGVGEVYAIAVDPSVTGKGWGSALVGEGLRHLAEEESCTTATLFVDGGNAPAMGLYESLGFEVVGTDSAWVRERQPKRI